MVKKVISVFSVMALVAVPFSALAADGGNNLAADTESVFKQINNGSKIVVESNISNVGYGDGTIVCELSQVDSENNVKYSEKSIVELDTGDSAVSKTTFSVDKIAADDKFVIKTTDENNEEIAQPEELYAAEILVSPLSFDDETYALETDTELENAWEVLSEDNVAQAMPMQTRASATLTSRNTLQCSDGTLVGFSEGMLANATMNFQSEVTNRGTSSNSATFYVASYLSNGALNDVSSVSTGSISSGSSKIVTKTLSKSLYSTINNVKTYTWDPSMVPCCDAVQYKKNSHNDNFTVGSSILSKANNYLMMKLNTKLNGSLSSSSDVDVVAYKATSTRSVSISKSTPGGSFKVDVYNSSGSLISSNPSSFSTTSGNTYYLRISGTSAGNYTVTLK